MARLLRGTSNAAFFAPAVEDVGALVVPAITLYEVCKRLLVQRDETDALRAVAQMRQGRVVDVDAALALEAARLSLAHRLPMADSLILATARWTDAALRTQDADFEGLDGVRYTSASPTSQPPAPPDRRRRITRVG